MNMKRAELTFFSLHQNFKQVLNSVQRLRPAVTCFHRLPAALQYSHAMRRVTWFLCMQQVSAGPALHGAPLRPNAASTCSDASSSSTRSIRKAFRFRAASSSFTGNTVSNQVLGLEGITFTCRSAVSSRQLTLTFSASI